MAKGNSVKAAAVRRTPTDRKGLTDSGIAGVVSCNNGAAAYVRMPTGATTRHLVTSSPDFDATLAEIVALGVGAKYQHEIEVLAAAKPASAWPAVVARLRANGVWDVA